MEDDYTPEQLAELQADYEVFHKNRWEVKYQELLAALERLIEEMFDPEPYTRRHWRAQLEKILCQHRENRK